MDVRCRYATAGASSTHSRPRTWALTQMNLSHKTAPTNLDRKHFSVSRARFSSRVEGLWVGLQGRIARCSLNSPVQCGLVSQEYRRSCYFGDFLGIRIERNRSCAIPHNVPRRRLVRATPTCDPLDSQSERRAIGHDCVGRNLARLAHI